MIPQIISGSNQQARQNNLQTHYPESSFTYQHLTAEKSSITIEQIHNLLNSLIISSSVPRLIWIEEANLITLPAQNALLKILEEPPANTQFVLTLDNHRSLLPTIISRCKVTMLQQPIMSNNGSCLQLIKQALNSTMGSKINIADQVGKKREEAILWIEQCLHEIDYKIKTESNPASLTILAKIALLVHTAYLDLKANVSVSLALQHMFLSLPLIRNSS